MTGYANMTSADHVQRAAELLEQFAAGDQLRSDRTEVLRQKFSASTTRRPYDGPEAGPAPVGLELLLAEAQVHATLAVALRLPAEG